MRKIWKSLSFIIALALIVGCCGTVTKTSAAPGPVGPGPVGPGPVGPGTPGNPVVPQTPSSYEYSVNFYIRLNDKEDSSTSTFVDQSNDKDNYTGALAEVQYYTSSTKLTSDQTFAIESNSVEALAANSNVVEEKLAEMGITSVPTLAQILEGSYASTIKSVDKYANVTADDYEINWYVIKYQVEDVDGNKIHVDGVIVKKPHEHTNGTPVKEKEVAATCTKAGSYDTVIYCTSCKEEISREGKTVDALGHIAGEEVKENEVAATYEADGSYDLVTYCTRENANGTICNAELSRSTITVDKLVKEEIKEEIKEEQNEEPAQQPVAPVITPSPLEIIYRNETPEPTPVVEEVVEEPVEEVVEEPVVEEEIAEEPVEEVVEEPVVEEEVVEEPVEEEIIEVEEVIETPEGTPEEEEVVEEPVEEPVEEEVAEEPVEEEIELEEVETPQGDDTLPQTGVASAAVVYGIGAMCFGAGSTMMIRARRKED